MTLRFNNNNNKNRVKSTLAHQILPPTWIHNVHISTLVTTCLRAT